MANEAFLLGALNKLDALLAKIRGGSPEAFAKNASVVGNRWSEAAADPNFFSQGNKYALTDPGLAAQFGVGPKRSVMDPNDQVNFGERMWSAEPGSSSVRGLYEKNKSYADILANPSSSVTAADRAGLLRPGNKYRVFDTVTLDAGSGQGTKLYPAAYGSLLTEPNTYNIVDGLSAENSIRRNFNQASAALRDPALADRIITAPSQLRDVPGLSVADVHAMPALQRIGALQLAGSAGTIASLSRQLANNMLRLKNGNLSVPEQSALEYSTNQIAHQINRLNGTQGALSSLGNTVRQHGNPYSMVPFGDRTSRRLGLSLRALEGDRNFSDITPGLEYCVGGLVNP